jgi:hypothetical protein
MTWYYSPGELRKQAEQQAGRAIFASNAVAMMTERVPVQDRIIRDSEVFDIFLSYRNADAEYAFGIYLDLTHRSYRVYLDKVADAQLDRSKVTRETAEVLRKRLMQSKSLFYIVSEKSDQSNWMPWELGFEDGYRGKSAIVPVADKNRGGFVGVEFIALYPKVVPVSDNYLWIDTPDEAGDLTHFPVWRDSIPDRKCGMPKCPLR